MVDIALCICRLLLYNNFKRGVMSQVNDNYVVCIAVPCLVRSVFWYSADRYRKFVIVWLEQ